MTATEQIERLDLEADRIAKASRKAIDSAIRVHEGFQQPMAVWIDGRPAWVTPAEARNLLLPDTTTD
ncbi:MAG: hypothetical protein U0929_11755 [Planctomycetaceae bacterium]